MAHFHPTHSSVLEYGLKECKARKKDVRPEKCAGCLTKAVGRGRMRECVRLHLDGCCSDKEMIDGEQIL